MRRPLRFERLHSDAFDAGHRPMKNHVAAVDLLGEDYAVLVFAGDAGAVSAVRLRCEKVFGGDQANARTSRRVAGISDGVTRLVVEPGDARILDAPFFVCRFARNSRAVTNLVDVLAVGGKRQAKARSTSVVLEYTDEQNDASACAIDCRSGIERSAGSSERNITR